MRQALVAHESFQRSGIQELGKWKTTHKAKRIPRQISLCNQTKKSCLGVRLEYLKPCDSLALSSLHRDDGHPLSLSFTVKWKTTKLGFPGQWEVGKHIRAFSYKQCTSSLPHFQPNKQTHEVDVRVTLSGLSHLATTTFSVILLSIRSRGCLIYHLTEEGHCCLKTLSYHELRASACHVGKEGRSLCISCTKKLRSCANSSSNFNCLFGIGIWPEDCNQGF